MPIPRIFEIQEANHRILDPFTPAKLHQLGSAIGLKQGTSVLDLACGKGEMLATWARDFGITGHGVDFSEAFSASAQERIRELHVEDRVHVDYGDAAGYVAENQYDVASCCGATWIGGGVEGTIDLLTRSLAPGGIILIGEPFWRSSPSAEAQTALGIMDTDFSSLHELTNRFHRHRMDLVEMVLSNEDDWDRYLAATWFTMRQWLEEHPGDEMTTVVREELTRSQLSYARYQRDLLGWGVFALKHL